MADIWENLLDLEAARNDKGFLKTFRRPPIFVRDSFYALTTLLFKAMFAAEIKGLENIPARGPYIIAPNHSSALDYPVVAWAMPRAARDGLYAVTTSYFYDNPFTRFFIMIATNSIRIDTTNEYEPALRAAAKVLAQGGSLYINPEGTWSEDGKLMAFKPGVGLLSYELKVPIVPVRIDGTFDVLPPHALFPKKRGKVTVTFGRPLIPEAYSKLEAGYETYSKIAGDVREEIVRLGVKKTGV